MINKSAIEQYSNIFGNEKMAYLWKEFLDKACLDLAQVDKYLTTNAYNELRLIYHSLRSSSLVFGMEDFSAVCKEIEEKILENSSTEGLEEKVKKGQEIFNNNRKEVAEVITKEK